MYACWVADRDQHDCQSCSAQKKWDADDSPYRTEEFYEKAMKGWKVIGNVSKGERELAEKLQQRDNRFILNEFTTRIGPYYPDIIHHEQKLLVEYYGDGIHGNPVKFKPNDRLLDGSLMASDAWEKDAKRQHVLEAMGWRFEIVWASEWNKNQMTVIERIIALTC
jgi:very-short-patch-repair endonuclease